MGAPYILMDYIHGTSASDMRIAQNYDSGLFGTPQQDKAFKRELATVHATLATCNFDQSGSLYEDSATGEFRVGPDNETNKGPWQH